MYDLIIVSQSVGDLIQVTQNCIDSIRQDEVNINIIVVETGQPYKYDVDKIIEYNGEFNYNRALNLGLRYTKNDYHVLCNNDLIFRKGWSQMADLMKANDYHSASGLSSSQKIEKGDFIYEGYEIGIQFTGWCLFMDDYCLNKIKKLDETVSFWYSDNLYACQLKREGIRHGLFANIQIDHITSRTLVRQSKEVQMKYQLGERRKYNERKNYYA